jgi:glutaminase
MDLKKFFTTITEIYEELKSNEDGKVADYIPQLGKVDPSLFSVVVHTMDNQRLVLGDSNIRYCIQSCSKPLTYMLALKENGFSKVAEHINTEPSGKQFNALEFDEDNKPHNGMINAGAIMSTSLVKADQVEDARYAYILNTWKKMLGDNKIGFDNEVYMGEKRTANRNYALAHLMQDNDVFPKGTDIEKTLQLYFQSCSITMNAESMALFAAILANGGVSPITGEIHFSSDIIKSVLCVMATSGMYDYSGRWFYNVGLPAKSGVSGCIMVVVPNICGICVYSPRLDKYGNSVRGVKLFNKLVKSYRMHIFDSFIVAHSKCKAVDGNIAKLLQFELYNCANSNDHIRMKQLLESDIDDVNLKDYDQRYPLHIAVESKSYECIWLLIIHGANYNVTDRWGVSPFNSCIKNKDKKALLIMTLGKAYYNRLREGYIKLKSN